MKLSAFVFASCLAAILPATGADARQQKYPEILPARALRRVTLRRPAVAPPPRGAKNWASGPPRLQAADAAASLSRRQIRDPDEEDSEHLREQWELQPAPEAMHDLVSRALGIPGVSHRPVRRTAVRFMSSGSPASAAWEQVGQGIYQKDDANGGHPRAGRIHAAAYAFDNTQNASPLWLGASGGGLWKAVDVGLFAVWVPMSDNLPGSPSVGAFLVQPGNSNNILIGSGDLFRYRGDGMYKTTDGGATWTRTTLSPVPDAFQRIICDASDPTGNTVLAQGTGGVWRSTDFGDTWTQVYDSTAYDLAQDPVNTWIWYVGVPGAGIFRSRDGGMSFPTSTNPADGDISAGIDTGCDRVSMSICAAEPNRVYAISDTRGGSLNGIWRSDDYGAHFTSIFDASVDKLSIGQGFHAIAIAVDPTNADRLYCGMGRMQFTENATDNNPFWIENLLPLTDGGHPDYTSFTFQPNSTTLVITNDGGCYFYDTSLHTVSGITNLEGLNCEQLFDVNGTMAESYSVPQLFLAGLQDNGIVKFDPTLSTSLLQLPGGDGGYCSIQSDNPLLMAASDGQPFGRMLSLDGGATWPGVDLSLPGDTWPIAETLDPRLGLGTPNLFTWKHVRDPVVSWQSTLYFKPADTTTDWQLAGPQLPDGYFVRLVEKAMNPSVDAIYVSSNLSGKVYEFEGTPGAMTVTERTPPLSKFAFSSAGLVNADRSVAQPDTVYYTTSASPPAQAFLSTDRGVNWTEVTGDASNFPVGIILNKLIGNPGDLTNLFLATNIGVFRSDNSGKNWYPFMDGLPAVLDARDITLNYDVASQPLLHMATNGRGFWQRTVAPDAVLMSIGVLADPVTGGLPDTGVITLDRPAGPNGATVSLTAAAGPIVVPPTVIVSPGASTAEFPVMTSVVTSTQIAKIDAAYHDVVLEAGFPVVTIGPVSLTFTPNPVPGSVSATGTITLDEPAAPGDITVSLSSGNPAVASAQSPTITIPAGSTSGTFTAATTAVAAAAMVPFTAAANGRSAGGALTVRPIGVASLTPSSTTVRGGLPVHLTVTLEAPAAPGNITVAVATSNPLLANPKPTSILVGNGNIGRQFVVLTSRVTATTTVQVTATANGISQSCTLTLTP